MPSRPSLYDSHPDYTVQLTPNPAHVRVSIGKHLVADSTTTVIVQETGHDDVIYVPRTDVRFDLLTATDHTTFCPFKGDAGYWSFLDADENHDNIVWGYDDPFPQVAALREYVAFYPARVSWEIEGR